MSKHDTRFFWEGIGETLGFHLESGKERITILAPYVKRPTLERLLLNVNTSLQIDVITRWEVDEIAAGVSDTSILELAKQWQRLRVFLADRLHAKLYLIDDRIACLGSANITNAALGWSEVANVEVMAIINPAPVSLLVLAHRLLSNAVEATEDLRKTFQDAADLGKGYLPPPAFHRVSLPFPKRVKTLFPSMRSPEKLFSAYSEMYNVHSKEERQAALNDLGRLAMPDGLEEGEFLREVGSRLFRVPEVADFDAFVIKPKRFGELTNWAKERMSDLQGEHKASQRYVQCLIRWLRYFLPSRYILAEPKYSEIFGRRPINQP